VGAKRLRALIEPALGIVCQALGQLSGGGLTLRMNPVVKVRLIRMWLTLAGGRLQRRPWGSPLRGHSAKPCRAVPR